MKPIRIFRHAALEGPGYLATYLDNRNLPYETVCIDAGDTISERLDDVSALVFMGGPMSVNDDLPWIAQEIKLIQRAAAAGMPVLGHCLGGQLISKALGAKVTANPVKEIGWHPVRIVEGQAAHGWLGNLPETFEVFHWHGETFGLPVGATPILRSTYCANQAFIAGNMLALQCHIEMTVNMVDDWVAHGQNDLVPASASVQNSAEIRQNLPAKVAALQQVARILYNRWLQAISNADRALV